jgi:hypothetical protein
MFEVVEAKREAAPILAAFAGQSGSGKTLSALLFARGLVGPSGKIVVIDTEGKRSLIYADNEQVGGFMHIDFVAPFSSERFQEAVKAAVAANADCIIIDSASHEHEAEGGFLEYADAEERRIGGRGASRSKWIKPKGARNRFIRSLTSAPCHVILCIRQKEIVDMEAKPPRKILKTVCGDDLMFEMKIVVELETGTHRTRFTKVPLPFQKHIREGEMITVEHGELLLAEAGKGIARDTETDQLISELKSAAENGWQSAQTAWDAAWSHATPVQRAAMRKHQQELRRIAGIADASEPEVHEDAPEGEFGTQPPAPDEPATSGLDFGGGHDQ